LKPSKLKLKPKLKLRPNQKPKPKTHKTKNQVTPRKSKNLKQMSSNWKLSS